jgi:hypothetical protein
LIRQDQGVFRFGHVIQLAEARFRGAPCAAPGGRRATPDMRSESARASFFIFRFKLAVGAPLTESGAMYFICIMVPPPPTIHVI